MNDEAAALGDLTPAELQAFATGYLEAIRDQKAEWDRLITALETTEQALAREKRAADIYYHDAYCNCRKQMTRNVVTSSGMVVHRTYDDGFSGP